MPVYIVIKAYQKLYNSTCSKNYVVVQTVAKVSCHIHLAEYTLFVATPNKSTFRSKAADREFQACNE